MYYSRLQYCAEKIIYTKRNNFRSSQSKAGYTFLCTLICPDGFIQRVYKKMTMPSFCQHVENMAIIPNTIKTDLIPIVFVPKRTLCSWSLRRTHNLMKYLVCHSCSIGRVEGRYVVSVYLWCACMSQIRYCRDCFKLSGYMPAYIEPQRHRDDIPSLHTAYTAGMANQIFHQIVSTSKAPRTERQFRNKHYWN